MADIAVDEHSFGGLACICGNKTSGDAVVSVDVDILGRFCLLISDVNLSFVSKLGIGGWFSGWFFKIRAY